MSEREFLIRQAWDLVMLHRQYGKLACNGAYSRQAHGALVNLLCKGVVS